LEQKEVDWSRGRILRKRSKAKKRKTCPVVNYKSWDETFRLLKQFRSNDATLVLLNERGKPLRSLTLKEDGKLRTNDSVRKALVALCKKLKIEQPPPKGFRKTSSTLVFNAKQFRGLDALFLGQSPKSVADIHYNAVGETILDEAIDYLAVQYGIK
jgi:integrase